MSVLQEFKNKDELGKIVGKRPVDTIREMNPGKFIPTGVELAKMLRDQGKKIDEENQS